MPPVILLLLIVSCITTGSARNARSAKGSTKECQRQGLLAVDRKTGQCLSGYEVSGNCCRKCTTCPPGYEKKVQSNQCSADCQACRWEHPIFEFSNEDVGTENCSPCIPCDLINRVTLVNCTRTHNAECGACKPGYTSLDVRKENSPCTLTNDPLLTSKINSDTQVQAQSVVKQPAQPSSDDNNTYKHATMILAACIALLLACIVVLVVFIGRDRCLKRLKQRAEDEGIEMQNRENARLDPALHYEEEAQPDLMAEVTAQPNYAREETEPLTVGSASKQKTSEFGSHDSSVESSGETDGKSYTSEEEENEETCFTGSSNVPSYRRSVSLPNGDRSQTKPESLQSVFESVLSVYNEDKLNCMNNEYLLNVAKTKAGQRVINDTPEDILDILGHFLDSDVANRNPGILKGRVRFAMRLGLKRELASTFTNSNDLFLHLKGKRMKLFKMLEALFEIDRCDALCEVAKAMFKSQQCC